MTLFIYPSGFATFASVSTPSYCNSPWIVICGLKIRRLRQEIAEIVAREIIFAVSKYRNNHMGHKGSVHEFT